MAAWNNLFAMVIMIDKVIPFLNGYEPWVKNLAVIWLITGLALFVLLLFKYPNSQDKKSYFIEGQNPLSVVGNNNMAVSGNNNTINQTIIQNNDKTEEILKILKEKAKNLEGSLAEEYPQGYVLFGKYDGRIVYEPRLKEAELSFDWDKVSLEINQNSGYAKFILRDVYVSTGGLTMQINRLEEMIPLTIGSEVPTKLFHTQGPKMFYKLVDVERKIFVVGMR
jgi:Ca2+/Na+ antiporter